MENETDCIYITKDLYVYKYILNEGDDNNLTPTALSRVYVNIKGLLPSKEIFLDSYVEEIDFILGHASMPSGLEMSIVNMKKNEEAMIIINHEKYGYSDHRRPSNIKKSDIPLTFYVKLIRWENEKNISEMSIIDKFNFINDRINISKKLFNEKNINQLLNNMNVVY